MAKSKDKIKVRMVSEESPYFFTTTRNKRAEKLRMRRYDPRLKKHVWFKETTINKSKK